MGGVGHAYVKKLTLYISRCFYYVFFVVNE